eukprot:TRINITY_DN44881_c0_g1_i1.p1 TRINITY_DN44881_c0_g1~~TRINITY_DN44881_c0_g1_i1.p1  ORF type:complete len:212 (+),score=41.56 TRINITY_DN44881_c0_g1_i1:1-636(+)
MLCWYTVGVNVALMLVDVLMQFFFFKQKTAYEMQRGLVGSEMCIRDRYMGRARLAVQRQNICKNLQRRIKMTSSSNGITLKVKPQVTEVSFEQITVVYGDEIFVLPFKRYPWFAECTLHEIQHVELLGDGLEWPDAVIGLELDLLRHPEKGGKLPSLDGWRKIRASVRAKEARKTFAKAGGSKVSIRKAAASRTNGAKGGRPRKNSDLVHV